MTVLFETPSCLPSCHNTLWLSGQLVLQTVPGALWAPWWVRSSALYLVWHSDIEFLCSVCLLWGTCPRPRRMLTCSLVPPDFWVSVYTRHSGIASKSYDDSIAVYQGTGCGVHEMGVPGGPRMIWNSNLLTLRRSPSGGQITWARMSRVLFWYLICICFLIPGT